VDQTALVNSDLEIEGKVVAALSVARIPVTAVDWSWEPELERSQLIVVTNLVDTRGPRETYARIIEALGLAGVYQAIPFGKIYAKSPADPVARKLIEELKRISKGSIHIIRSAPNNSTPHFNVVFAPYLGSGGAIPSKRLVGENDLRVFLEKRLSVIPYFVDQALAELADRNSATIFNVELNSRRAKRLNLAA